MAWGRGPVPARGSVTSVNPPLKTGRKDGLASAGRRKLPGWGPAWSRWRSPWLMASTSRSGPMRWTLASICAWAEVCLHQSPVFLRSPNTSLPFTYPPFAALLFAPWQRGSTASERCRRSGPCARGCLVGVLVLSVRLVKPSLDRMASGRLALALSLPPPPQSGADHHRLRQVNLFVTFLVEWDLLSERRIGKTPDASRRGDRAGGGGQATPLLFVPYLLLTRRWRGALTCVLTFVACELMTFASRPRHRRPIGRRPSSSPVVPATSPSSTIRISGACSIG